MNKIIIVVIGIIILALITVFVIAGYQPDSEQPAGPSHKVLGTGDLVPNEQDLLQNGIKTNRLECQAEEDQTDFNSEPVHYLFCNFTINNLNDTDVVIELKRFANQEALNGTYQYDSSHLYSIQSLISENVYGDQSRFRLNNVNDYGGQFNEPGVYYYHLWICKDVYLIHITSGGRNQEAGEYVTRIGQQILSKFG